MARRKLVQVRQHYPIFSFDDQNWLDVTRPDVVSIVETVKKDDGASKTDPIRWGCLKISGKINHGEYEKGYERMDEKL